MSIFNPDLHKESNPVVDRLKEDFKMKEFIPSYIFSSPEIYKLEVERVFTKSWIFVAHESEILEPGDYVTRSIGEQPVIVSRGEDGQVNVLLNICRHRGMKVCRTDLGNSAHFRCPYHGFTYKSSGELIGVPFQKDTYGGDLNKSDLGLLKPRVESYKGLIFATWYENIVSLDEYLGDMKWYIDLIVGRADMEVVGPPQRWVVSSNWKLGAENFASDAYHTAHTHGSVVEVGLAGNPAFAKFGYHINTENGHGLGLGTGMPGTPDILSEDLIPEYEKNLTADQMTVLKTIRNLHATIFPNLSFILPTSSFDGSPISVVSLRIWQPKGPDKMEIVSFFLVEKNASESWKERSRRAYVLTFGSSGIFEQDDTENWSDITENTRQLLGVDNFLFNVQMGIGRETAKDFLGPGKEIYDSKYNEANSRAFYRRWFELMSKDE